MLIDSMKKTLKSFKQSFTSLSSCVAGPATSHGPKNREGGREYREGKLKNELDGEDSEIKPKNGGDGDDPETKLEIEEGERDGEDPEIKPKNEGDGVDPETKLKNGGDVVDPKTKLKNGEAGGEDPETKLKNGEADGEDPETKLKSGVANGEGPETKLKNVVDEKDAERKLKNVGDEEDPETKLKNGERDGEDPQSQWLRVRHLELGKSFKEQAIEYVKQAVQEDNAGNYAKAFSLYMNALEYFKTYLKYEKNPKIREAVTQKFNEYLRRAEEITFVLNEGGHARPATKPKDGEGSHYAIVREKPNVKWNDVAGVESAKQALQEAVILPVRFPHFFTGKRQPWRAFLLYGPPGTGKSYLAKAVATEVDSTFFSVSSSDLVSMLVEESEKLVLNLFQMARESAPSIIFIDEIDSLSGERIKTDILSQMQGVGTHDDKVLILAATHTPYSLDQDIRRRFDKCIYITLPDLKARGRIFKVHLGDAPNDLNESDFESLARKTEGFSGSDIDVCVKDVLFEPVRKTQEAMFFDKTNEGFWVPCEPKQPGAVQTTMQELAAQGLAEKISPPSITRTDFDKVLLRLKPTVSKSDLEVHERFTKEFGEEG